VAQGDYQNASVYGHVAQIDVSGKIKGHTSMMLRFDRLVLPDGRRAPIHAEIVELYHAALHPIRNFGAGFAASGQELCIVTLWEKLTVVRSCSASDQAL